MAVSAQDLARTLVARQRARLQALDRRAEQAKQAVTTVATLCLSRGELDASWIVGSLSNGTFGQASDVDVVVRGLRPSFRARLWGELSEATGLSVDLLLYEELTSSFRERVEKEGLRVA
jgi:predicted nucleotidyltransferase